MAMTALAAGYVLLTAIAGPLAAKYPDSDHPQVVENTESAQPIAAGRSRSPWRTLVSP